VVDWSGGVFASCMPRIQLYVNACNGWPQFALQHHWLLPINCHFLLLHSAAGRGIAAVSSDIPLASSAVNIRRMTGCTGDTAVNGLTGSMQTPLVVVYTLRAVSNLW